MSDLTPAERLNAAADLLETTAAKATVGTWTAQYTGSPRMDGTGQGSQVIRGHSGYKLVASCRRGNESGFNDAAWIALVGPDIAPHLAAILREEAAGLQALQRWDGLSHTEDVTHAPAFADRTLGDTP